VNFAPAVIRSLLKGIEYLEHILTAGQSVLALADAVVDSVFAILTKHYAVFRIVVYTMRPILNVVSNEIQYLQHLKLE